VFRRAGLKAIESVAVDAPLHMASAAECVRFERQSFGALHQMLSGLDDSTKEAVWNEIADELRIFEGEHGFAGPCELVIAVGEK